MLGKNVPTNVKIGPDVRDTLQEWLRVTKHGETPSNADSPEWDKKKEEVHDKLTTGSFVETGGKPFTPPKQLSILSLVNLGVRELLGKGNVVQARSNPETGTFEGSDDSAVTHYGYSIKDLAEQYGDYDYQTRNGYCEKATTQACFHIPGASASFGLLFVLSLMAARIA